jgi:hypothetical protein
METLRSLWPRYKGHNEIRPLIMEILRLQRTLRTIEDLCDMATKGQDTDHALGMLLVLMRAEPCLSERVPNEALNEWAKRYLPPKD